MEDFARTIALESAKPLKTARVEAKRAVSTFTFAAVEARRLTGDMVPIDAAEIGEGRLAFTLRVPIGVVGAISPFNFPLNLVAHKLAPAIAAGCPVVLKPASQTPLTAVALADLLVNDAGLPADHLHVVTGSGGDVGDALVRHPDVAYLTFTGSGEVGWAIKERAGRKKVALELGNNSPVVIEADGDWRAAARGRRRHRLRPRRPVVRVGATGARPRTRWPTNSPPPWPPTSRTWWWATPSTSPPTCPPSSPPTTATGWWRGSTRRWRPGPGSSPAARWATTGSSGPRCWPTSRPTCGCAGTRSSARWSPSRPTPSTDEGLRLADDTRYGLQAGIYTSSLATALRAARELHFGAVLVNEVPTWRADQMPYGGVRSSGNTKEGPAAAVREMTEERLVVIKA